MIKKFNCIIIVWVMTINKNFSIASFSSKFHSLQAAHVSTLPRLASSVGCFLCFLAWNSRFRCYQRPVTTSEHLCSVLCLRVIALGLSDPCLDSEREEPVDKGEEAEAGAGSKTGLGGGRSKRGPCTQLLGNSGFHPSSGAHRGSTLSQE